MTVAFELQHQTLNMYISYNGIPWFSISLNNNTDHGLPTCNIFLTFTPLEPQKLNPAITGPIEAKRVMKNPLHCHSIALQNLLLLLTFIFAKIEVF